MRVENPNKLKPVPDDVNTFLDLPEGWAYPKIGEILTVNYGKGLKESVRVPMDVAVYGSNGIVGQHQIALTKGPTIIIGRKGTVGAVHFSNDACWPIDTTYYIDEFNGLEPKYLLYSLRSLSLTELDTSTAIPGLNRNELYDQHLPLSPLPEQKRIVAKLGGLLTRVNATKERLAKVSMVLKRFRQAVLAAACSGRLTEDWREKNPHVTTSQEILTIKIKNIYQKHLKNLLKLNELKNDNLPNKWSYATLPYLVSNEKYSIKRGPFGSSLKKEYFVDKGYKVYEQQHVIRNDFTIGKYYIDEKKFYELKAFEINPGDLIISCSGTIGRVAIVPQEIEKGIINQALLKLKLDKDVILDKYFVYMFGDFVSKQEFLLNVKGIAITNIASVEELKQILFPIPLIDEQHEIVRRVESMFN